MARLLCRKGNVFTVFLCVLALQSASSVVTALSPLSRLASVFTRWFRNNNKRTKGEPLNVSSNETADDDNNNMGQAMRAMKYDRAANERAAISALNLGGQALDWFRLDDGVMGGQSETVHQTVDDNDSTILHFTGTINTNGGGFASIRARFPPNQHLSESTSGVKIRFRGDGKTYKFLLSQGRNNAGAPTSRTPSWQADIPTKPATSDDDDDWQEQVIPFDSLLPSFGGGPVSGWGADSVKFDPTAMSEVGFMLSLKLSSGAANPKETFGEGIFPFSFHVQSVEPVAAGEGDTTTTCTAKDSE